MSTVVWHQRAIALTPAGLLVTKELVPALLSLLRQYDAKQLSALSVVATRDLVVLLGSSEALPWIDGGRYCAPDTDARNLWTPTHMIPALPTDLVQTNLIERAGSSPVLLWHAPEQLLPLAGAQVLTTAVVQWLTQELT